MQKGKFVIAKRAWIKGKEAIQCEIVDGYIIGGWGINKRYHDGEGWYSEGWAWIATELKSGLRIPSQYKTPCDALKAAKDAEANPDKWINSPFTIQCTKRVAQYKAENGLN